MNILNNINSLLEALKTEDIMKYNYARLERKVYTPYIDEVLDKIFGTAPVESKDPSKVGKSYKVQRIFIKTDIKPEYNKESLELYDDEREIGKKEKGKFFLRQERTYNFLKRLMYVYYDGTKEIYDIRNVEDYIKGYAFPLGADSKKQPIKIMKILNNMVKDKNFEKYLNIQINRFFHEELHGKKEDFLKLVSTAFNERPKFSENNYVICVSRLPSDVAGMSTDQRWSSCMELPGYNPNKMQGGCYNYYVERDIKLGTIVAYLIDSDPKARDLSTIQPYARISAKPFINENDEKDFILVAEDTYYADDVLSVNVYNEFKELFSKWLLKKQDKDIKNGVIYNKHSALYNDDKKTTYLKENLPEEKQKIYNKLKYYHSTSGSPLTTLYKYIFNTTDENFLICLFNNIEKINQFTIRERATLKSHKIYYVFKFNSWKSGLFEGNNTNSLDVLYIGNWYDGTWLNGNFACNFWANGIWKNGVWKDGEWHNGTWENGVWKDGDWDNGTWENGIWVNGNWMNGTWKDGTWKNGTWKDGTWEKGIIISYKFGKLIESLVNPKEFYELEKQCSTVDELQKKVGNK